MDFICTKANPIPDGAEAVVFEGPDGAPLRAGFFPASSPRGSIILLTGWVEFMEKYFEAIEELRARQFNVAMMDWRGQGGSATAPLGPGGWKGYFEQLRDDLRHFIDKDVAARFSGPKALMTHSMGGLPSLMLLGEGYCGVERAVLCAPMTRPMAEPMNSIAGLAAGVISTLGGAELKARNGLGGHSFATNIYTSDEDRYDRFEELKGLMRQSASAGPIFGWVDAACRSSQVIHQPGYFDRLAVPTLLVTAGREQQIDASDHATIAAAHALIEQAVIEGALHEIMMERDEIQQQFWQTAETFLAPSLPLPPVNPDR